MVGMCLQWHQFILEGTTSEKIAFCNNRTYDRDKEIIRFDDCCNQPYFSNFSFVQSRQNMKVHEWFGKFKKKPMFAIPRGIQAWLFSFKLMLHIIHLIAFVWAPSPQALINLYRKCRLRSDIASKNRNEFQPSFDFDVTNLYCYQPAN